MVVPKFQIGDIVVNHFMEFGVVEKVEEHIVKKYPEASPNELLAHPNCGIGSDGRFVVLDSSFFG